MNNYGYIYKTTNLINGRLYIGQKSGTFAHDYLGSGKLIQKAIKKYGDRNFRLEVIAFASNKLMLDGLEKKYIFEYRQVFGREFLYNITDGGEGRKAPISKEMKLKLSQFWKGKKKAPRTPEHTLNLSMSLKGKNKGKKKPPFTETHKRNISLSHKGLHISPATEWKKGQKGGILVP